MGRDEIDGKGIEVNEGELLIAIEDLISKRDPSPNLDPLVWLLCVITPPADPGCVLSPSAIIASELSCKVEDSKVEVDPRDSCLDLPLFPLAKSKTRLIRLFNVDRV